MEGFRVEVIERLTKGSIMLNKGSRRALASGLLGLYGSKMV